MNVFLSWSGQPSGRLAEIFSIWLPSVVQSIKPFYSPDIVKGDEWLREINENLDSTATGILFLTPNNLDSTWIMFEAGSLSKSRAISRVCPILFGLKKGELAPPLSQFQLTDFDKEDVRKLVASLNASLDHSLSEKVLNNSFEKWWPDLQLQVKDVFESPSTVLTPVNRPQDEVLSELLETVRGLANEQARRRNIGPGITVPPEASDEERLLIEDFNETIAFFAEKMFYLLRSGELPPDVRNLLGQIRHFIAYRQQAMRQHEINKLP